MNPKRILIVEDSPAIAGVVKEGLAGAGYETFHVNNGFEALRDLEEIKPDLIIADINMPKLDGLKFCAAIQKRPETAHIPFILLSSQFDEKTLQQGRALGACYFIAKPFNIKQVLDCVGKILA